MSPLAFLQNSASSAERSPGSSGSRKRLLLIAGPCDPPWSQEHAYLPEGCACGFRCLVKQGQGLGLDRPAVLGVLDLAEVDEHVQARTFGRRACGGCSNARIAHRGLHSHTGHKTGEFRRLA
jgi:hypothetical protein